MQFVGERQEYYARVLFIVFAVISALMFAYQIIILQRLRLIPVYLLPLLSFIICYENVILYYSNNIHTHSNEAMACYTFHSLNIPIFITVLFEMVYRLHELRTARFFFVPFDEGPELSYIPGSLLVGSVRFLVIGLFVMNILSDYEFVNSTAPKTGSGGYIYLAVYPHSAGLILNLVPTMVLSVVAIGLGVAMYRYGNRITFETSNNQFWKLLLISGFGYAVTHIFGPTYYSWTSNLGDIVLLVASTVLVQLVQDDLELARVYTDFLQKSNEAFNHLESKANDKVIGEGSEISNADYVEQYMRREPLQSKMSMGSMYPNALLDKIPSVTPKSQMKMRELTKKPHSDEQIYLHHYSDHDQLDNSDNSIKIVDIEVGHSDERGIR